MYPHCNSSTNQQLNKSTTQQINNYLHPITYHPTFPIDCMMMKKVQDVKRVLIRTLGCKLNYAETSAILEDFVKQGWEISTGEDRPDLVIIHTCAVTGKAEQKSRQLIRKMIQSYPGSRIVAVGCYAQLQPERLERIEGINGILGSEEKFNTANYIGEAESKVQRDILSRGSFGDAVAAHSLVTERASGRTRGFLKIQDGCDYGCAYCAIPIARGRSRSVPLADVLDGARRLSEAGYREIVLTGVNIADYRSGRAGLVELLMELDGFVGCRIRISSIEPDVLSDKLIETVASSSRIMPHFHLPLQSGSDRILAAMRRRYTTSGYRERLLRAVSTISRCAIGADVVTGYPGESEADFQKAVSFIEALPVAYLHVFPCSVRPGTLLAKQVDSGERGMVSPEEVRSRSRRLLALAERKQHEFLDLSIGHRLEVLVEECHEGENGEYVLSGYSENYLRVNVRLSSDRARSMVGKEVPALIEKKGGDLNLEGRFVT